MKTNWFRSKRMNNKGNVLAFTMIVLFALIAIAAPFFAVVMIEYNISKNQSYRVQAFYLADAGIAYGNNVLRACNGVQGASQYSGTSTMLVTYTGGTVGSFTVSIIPTTGTFGEFVWRIVSIGTPSDTYSRASVVGITHQATFSSYGIFRNTMGVPFGTGYVATGRIHVNDDILTDGTPQFNSPVTCTGVESHSGSGHATYLAGLTQHADYIPMPTYYNLDSVYSIASVMGSADVNYTHSTVFSAATVTFAGSSAIVVLTKSGATTVRFTYSFTTNGLLGLRPPVFVSGTVDGRVTIVNTIYDSSTSGITVTNNLQYADEGQLSNDMLGLMTGGVVQFAQNVPTNTYLDGCVLAPDSSQGKFQAGDALNSAHNSLNFKGSMTTWTNGSFVSGSNGFSTRNINFDTRLLYTSPPYFFLIDSTFHQIYWKNAYFL